MLYSTSLRTLCGVTLAAFTLAVPAAAQSPYGYSIIDLGPGIAHGINASGQVAGQSSKQGAFSFHAVRWTGNIPTDLGTLAGGSASEGLAINASGQVAGDSRRSPYDITHATLWTRTTATDLGTLGGTTSYAEGINNKGQVAGYAETAHDDFHAFRYSGGTMTDLGAGIAYGINASGQVAGNARVNGSADNHAVRWTGTTPTDLGTLGGNDSYARAINDSAQVTGISYLADYSQHAFRSSDAGMTDLGTLGGVVSEGYGINNAGVVVGDSMAADFQIYAFVAFGDSMINLNTLLPANSGWYLEHAYGINDNGQIVGRGYGPNGEHAFLLRPNAVPEPSALAFLFSSASVGASVRRKRRKR